MTFSGVSENLGNDVSNGWYSEVKNYDYSTGGFSMSMYFITKILLQLSDTTWIFRYFKLIFLNFNFRNGSLHPNGVEGQYRVRVQLCYQWQ